MSNRKRQKELVLQFKNCLKGVNMTDRRNCRGNNIGGEKQTGQKT